MSHAAELLRAGWLPDGRGDVITKSTVRQLPLPCDPEADDEAMIDKDGATHREQLMTHGVDRGSGQSTSRDAWWCRSPRPSIGCQHCGIRFVQPFGDEEWASGLPGGVFDEAAVEGHADVLLVGSAMDALAVPGAGHGGVVDPRRPGGFSAGDLHQLVRAGLHRCTVVGDGLGAAADDASQRTSSAPSWRRARRSPPCSGGPPIGTARFVPSSNPSGRSPRRHERHRHLRDVGSRRTGNTARCRRPSGSGRRPRGDGRRRRAARGLSPSPVAGARGIATGPDIRRVALSVTDGGTGGGGFHLDTPPLT